MGFIRDVRTIIAAVPKQRQTMLFSATISPEIRALAGDALRDPTAVEVGERRNPAETIKQYFYTVEPHAKLDLLIHALEKEQMQSVLVFSRTKHGADKICKRLERKGVNAVAIHSNRTQSQRDRALEGFRKGTTRVLVATDIAARGIDVDGISHVINYDIPHQPEDYIHRIGRTGRAGAVGDAITFIAREDSQYFRRIEQYVGKRIPVAPYDGFVMSSIRETVASRPTVGNARRVYSPSPRKGRVPQGSKGKKRVPMTAARKKTPPRKLDAFSSHSGGAGWSNY
jgi:ATP-dependent RNA helicase RhlE